MPHINVLAFSNSVLTHAPKCSESQDLADLTFQNGNTYLGPLRRGVLTGIGRYEWQGRGMHYTGEFRENGMEGKGELVWMNGARYEGEVKGNVRSGFGKWTSRSGSVYEGEWKQGKFHGKGTLTFKTEEGVCQYTGDWKEGAKHGHGHMQYATGNEYEGEWRDNRKEGHGRFVWTAKNEEYVGEWQNDKPHGKGRHTWFIEEKQSYESPFDNYYEGEWKEGKRHGKGTFQYSTGAVYVGLYERDMKNGYGEYIAENGKEYRGLWKNDKVVNLNDWCAYPELPWIFRSVYEAPHHSATEKEQILKEVNMIFQRHATPLRSIYAIISDRTFYKTGPHGSKVLCMVAMKYWSHMTESFVKMTERPKKILATFKYMMPYPSECDLQPSRKILFGDFLEWILHMSMYYNIQYIPEEELDKYTTVHAQKLAWLIKSHVLETEETLKTSQLPHRCWTYLSDKAFNVYKSLGNDNTLRDILIYLTKQTQVANVKLPVVEALLKNSQRLLKYVPSAEIDVMSYALSFPEFVAVMEGVALDVSSTVFENEEEDLESSGPRRAIGFDEFMKILFH